MKILTVRGLPAALALLALLGSVACAKEEAAPAAPLLLAPPTELPADEPAPAIAATTDTARRRDPLWLKRDPLTAPVAELPPLEGEHGPAAVYTTLRNLSETGDRKAMEKHITQHAHQLLQSSTESQIARVFAGIPGAISVEGGRARMLLEGAPGILYAVFLAEDRQWKYDITLSLKYREWELSPRHPDNQPVTLEEATEGIPGEGALYMELVTNEGNLRCRLYEELAPITVANFVGLARGKRAFRDPVTKKWTKRPFYEGTIFHKTVPDFMIQAGSLTKDGKTGPGFTIPDEFDRRLRHRDGGVLSMANSGPNTGGSQFFIAERALPWLDDRHSAFGRCWPTEMVAKIARRDKRPGSERPIVDIVIKELRFERE